MGSTVKVKEHRDCDFCKHMFGRQRLALYDGRTTEGVWAHMCQEHFDTYGVGLGTGRGQKFIYI